MELLQRLGVGERVPEVLHHDLGGPDAALDVVQLLVEAADGGVLAGVDVAHHAVHGVLEDPQCHLLF